MVNATTPWDFGTKQFHVHMKSQCSQSICALIIVNCIVEVLRGAVSDDTWVGQGGGTWLWCSLAASPQPLSGGPWQCHSLVESTGSFPKTWVGFTSSSLSRCGLGRCSPWLTTEWLSVLCTGLWGQPGRFEEWGRLIYFVIFFGICMCLCGQHKN